MANEEPAAVDDAEPFPWGESAQVQAEWAERHEPVLSFGVWMDANGKGCVRAKASPKLTIGRLGAALGLIHEQVDRMIRLVLAETEGVTVADDKPHSC